MKFKANQKIIWTTLELTGLLEEDDSCVHFKRTKKHLGLHPFHLKNLQKAINEILMSMLNTYDTELKGFLISYKNPKLLNNLGEILYDSHFIHVDIEADFYLFCPKVGCSLKGIVNKKGLDHIVLLVHKIFTVTIPKSDNEKEEWLGNTLEIGQEVKCCVTQIDRNTKLPSICATLSTDYLQGCRLPEIFHISNVGIDNKNNVNGIEINGSNITALEDAETPIGIKIEHSDPEYISDNIESSNQLQINDNTESRKRKKREHSEIGTTSEPEKKKKKKHKRKSIESDSESVYMTENEENIINNTMNTVHHIKEEQQEDNKKRKKSKKVPMVMLDSEPENYIIKVKKEKPDPIALNETIDEHIETDIYIKTEDSNKEKKKKSKRQDKIFKNTDSESVFKIKSEDKIINNISRSKEHNNEDADNTLESYILSDISDHEQIFKKRKTDIHIKTEDSDKEKKKKSKKRDKTFRNTNSEFEFGIKSEDMTNNTFKAKKHKYTEQVKHSKDNTLESDISSGISDHEHVSKKQKIDICIKTEDSDKEKKKKSKKHDKTLRDTDLEFEFGIKSEDMTNNTFKAKKHKYTEQVKHSKDNILVSDISSGISDHEQIPKKQKKDICIKTEDSDKEKKKKSKKRDKTIRDTDSEFEFRIKSEDMTNTFKVKKHKNESTEDEEQVKYTKHDTLVPDIFSDISDLEHVSKKQKKIKKSSKVSPDSKSKHVKIKEEDD